MPPRAAFRRRQRGGGPAARTGTSLGLAAALLACCSAACLLAAGRGALAAAFASAAGAPSPTRQAASRRNQLLGLAGAFAPPVAGASAVPIAFDYRAASELDLSKRVITGDVNSPAVQGAVAKLRENREKAKAAITTLKADALAEVSENFGLVGKAKEGDNIITSFKAGSGLQGAYAGPAEELRAICRTIDDIMDSRTRSDTERASRMMIAAWYTVIQDDGIKPLDKSKTTDVAGMMKKQSEKTQARIFGEIEAYLRAMTMTVNIDAAAELLSGLAGAGASAGRR